MKIEELRIGNYVQIDDLPIERVTLDVFATLREVPATISAFNPVPLTEEWLEKLGLDMVDSEGDVRYYQFENYGVKSEEGTDFYFYRGVDIISTLREVSFVHEVQNLLSALTGHETP